MPGVQTLRPLRFRTIFVSHSHLGTRGCQVGLLLDFLRPVRCETLFLVGDIIDFWSMRRGLYGPQEHNEVVRTILGMARDGTRVVYVPGNHDELFRDHLDTVFGNVELRARSIHTTADGRRRFGYGYWSLAAFLKHRVKNAVQYIGDFERALARTARRESVDGLVCGHIHRPEIRAREQAATPLERAA